MNGKKWTKEDLEILKDLIGEGFTHKDIAEVLERTPEAIKRKACKSKLKSKNNKVKTNEEYDKELKEKCPTIVRIGNYKNNKVKILHKCLVCGTEHKCLPGDKLQNIGHCGRESNGGIKLFNYLPGITYLVYIPKYNLYKIGVTSRSIIERMSETGVKINEYNIILERHFSSGTTAMQLEKEWLFNVRYFKINTGLLKNGNTETFKY